jgi:hypothetical protein
MQHFMVVVHTWSMFTRCEWSAWKNRHATPWLPHCKIKMRNILGRCICTHTNKKEVMGYRYLQPEKTLCFLSSWISPQILNWGFHFTVYIYTGSLWQCHVIVLVVAVLNWFVQPWILYDCHRTTYQRYAWELM